MKSITCRSLCKTFRQGEQIITGLDHVSLDIDEGEFVCLSGPSGSGKTTLLNAMGGLDTPDSGEICIGDTRLDTLGKSELADIRLNKIGFVFQAFNLLPRTTVLDNVLLPTHYTPNVDKVAAKERALDHFIAGRIRFTDMAVIVEEVLTRLWSEKGLIDADFTLDTIGKVDHLARKTADEVLKTRAE